MHGVLTPSQWAGVGGDPTKWSPSSTVKTKSVLLLLIPCGGEPVEELAERFVVVFQLLHVVRFARTAGGVDLACDAVLVVRVGDVPEGDRDSLLLHLRDVGEGRGRETARQSPGSPAARTGR